jgi:hypothetical protein
VIRFFRVPFRCVVSGCPYSETQKVWDKDTPHKRSSRMSSFLSYLIHQAHSKPDMASNCREIFSSRWGTRVPD